MIDKGLLISGNDIPFVEGQMFITQPKIKHILLLGENNFFQSCELITFSKDILNDKDKILLDNKTNFDVLMSIVNDKSKQTEETRENCLNILSLLFPEYEIEIQNNFIMFTKDGEIPHSISNENFEQFKYIIKDILCLNKKNKNDKEYNPSGPMAEKLANRFKKARQKVAASKGEKDSTVFDRYISILSVGLNMDINDILNYTIYQLYDVFERFSLKETYDISMQARMAGASSESLDKVEHWMSNIHS